VSTKVRALRPQDEAAIATPSRKFERGLQARAALLGWALQPQPDGSWSASRWGRVREFGDDVELVEAWLERQEGRRA